MCIIVYKKKNVNTKINWDILETCFNNNNDGAGYAIAYDGKLILRKGFMKWIDFKTSLEKTTKNMDIKKAAMLFHFRITTHGGTCRENTHPFPIGTKTLTERKYTNLDAAVAMNGICLSNEGYSKYSFSKAGKPAYTNSDTMDAIENVINPMYKISGSFWKNEQAETIFNWLGAKWAVLEKNGDITTFGEFNQSQGWNYSNLSWKTPKKKTWECYSWDSAGNYGKTYGESSYYGDSYFDYDFIPFAGKLKNSITGNILEVNYNAEYYLDTAGEVWAYDWETDDYVLLSNFVVLEESAEELEEEKEGVGV